MKTIVGASLLILAVLGTAGAFAGIHEADVEARLGRVVGDWTIEGQHATYRETCVWYADRAFVVCTTTDASDNSSSQSILGYSKTNGHYTYHNYGSGGTSRSETGFPSGEAGLVFTSERRTSAGLVRSQTVLTPEPDGRLAFRQERSIDGGPWAVAAEFRYIRREP
jgi:hypothetical protein